jgi:hypothetical protein
LMLFDAFAEIALPGSDNVKNLGGRVLAEP